MLTGLLAVERTHSYLQIYHIAYAHPKEEGHEQLLVSSFHRDLNSFFIGSLANQAVSLNFSSCHCSHLCLKLNRQTWLDKITNFVLGSGVVVENLFPRFHGNSGW